MAGAWIEAYAYSEGPTTGVSAALETVQTLGLNKLSTGVTSYSRPTSPQRWSDLIATWAASLSAQTGYTVGLTYSATTHRLTLTSSGTVTPIMVGAVEDFTGLTGTLAAGTSWTGAAAPGGRADLLGVTVEPADDWTHSELAQYRHGRARATVWGNHQVHRCTLYCTGDAIAAIQKGWLQAGRVRLYQSNAGDGLSPYNYATVGGYVDGYVIACGPGEEQSANLWVYTMLIGVAR